MLPRLPIHMAHLILEPYGPQQKGDKYQAGQAGQQADQQGKGRQPPQGRPCPRVLEQIPASQRRAAGRRGQAADQEKPLPILPEPMKALRPAPHEGEGQEGGPGRVPPQETDRRKQLGGSQHRIPRPAFGRGPHLPVPLVPDQMERPDLLPLLFTGMAHMEFLAFLFIRIFRDPIPISCLHNKSCMPAQ